MPFQKINPDALAEPRGWNHGMLAPAGGRILFVAGQTAAGPDGVAHGGFVEQFGTALDAVLTVVREAGGGPEHVGRMTVYVTDMEAYRRDLKPLGEAWRGRMGREFPAMALVEVKSLVDEGAIVEIEATAVLDPAGGIHAD